VRNITVSLPDDVYREARIKAASRDSSVSALVREFLTSLAGEEDTFARLKRLETEALSTVKTFNGGDRLTRDRVHQRRAVR
jgi:plasmid stability protein